MCFWSRSDAGGRDFACAPTERQALMIQSSGHEKQEPHPGASVSLHHQNYECHGGSLHHGNTRGLTVSTQARVAKSFAHVGELVTRTII
jgi:hypothetical protein